MDDRSSRDPVGGSPALAGFFFILVLLLVNAVVGFREEHQAGNAIAALKAKLAIKARVKRVIREGEPRRTTVAGTWPVWCGRVSRFRRRSTRAGCHR